MRIILTIGAALVLGSTLMHAEPARCQGRECQGTVMCFGQPSSCRPGCWCTASDSSSWGVCVGPGQ